MNPEPSHLADIAKATMTVLTPLFGGIWLLIKRWGAMAEKVKRAQAQTVLTSVEALKEELEESKKVQALLTDKLSQTREELVAIKTRLEMSLKSEEKFGRRVDDMREIFDRRVKQVENTLDNGQLVREGDALKFQIKQKG